MVKNPPSAAQSWNPRAWSAQEDEILINYVKTHGEGKWPLISRRTELKRSGKSCRMRWLNYLRPDIKRGNISEDEEDLIIRLHKLLGNRWSLIAGRLPGRTDSEIKNYWNSYLKKKVEKQKTNMDSNIKKPADMNLQLSADNSNHKIGKINTESHENSSSSSSVINKEGWWDVILDLDINLNWRDIGCCENVANFPQSTGEAVLDFFKNNNINETAENGSSIDPFQINYPLDLKNLSKFLGLE